MTTTNEATHYASGDTVDIDFAVSERTGHWQYGLAGVYAWQLQGDKKNGMEVPGGNKIGVVSLGPVVAYRIPGWKSVIKAKVLLPVYEGAPDDIGCSYREGFLWVVTSIFVR